MSNVSVNLVDNGQLERAKKLLAGIPDGVNKAIRSALPRAASHLRTQSSSAVRKRYAITNAALRAEQNVRIKYTYGESITGTVTFAGNLIGLYKFQGAAPIQPTVHQNWTIQASVHGKMRNVHPSVAARGHQLVGTAPMLMYNTFTQKMKNGHMGIFERTGGKTFEGDDQIHEIMGSSIAQMVGNENVAEPLAESAAIKFQERFDHEVTRILNGWGG